MSTRGRLIRQQNQYIKALKRASANAATGDRLVSAISNRERLQWTNLAQYADQARVYTLSSWVYIAVNMIAKACALVNFQVYSRSGEDKNQIPNHELELLLQQPNQYHTQFEFIEATVAFRELTGNAYWFINGVPGKPQEFILLRPDMVRIVPGTSTARPVEGYVYEVDGIEIPLTAEEVAHFTLFNPTSQYYGLSRLQAAALAVQTDLSAQTWNRNFFGRDSAIPSGVVNIKNKVTTNDFNRIKEEWKETYGGTERKTAFIRGGDVEYQTIGLNHTDLDFLEGRQFTKEEIFAIYGIPAGVIDKNATEANADVGDRILNDKTIWPIMTALGQKITTDIARPLYGDNFVVEPEDIRFKDRASERAEIRTAESFMTVNEIRDRYYQLPPLPDTKYNEPAPFIRGAAMPALGAGGDPEKETDDTAESDEKESIKALRQPIIIEVVKPGQIIDVLPVSRSDTSIEVAPIQLTSKMKTELEQFERYAGKGKNVDSFRFNYVPNGLAIATKALADISELDLLPIKAVGLSGSVDASNDPYWRDKVQIANKFKAKTETYFRELAARLVEGVKHVDSPLSGKALPDEKRFLSYFDDEFWDEELDKLARVMRPLVYDAVLKGAIRDSDALYMSTGISFDQSVFEVHAQRYAQRYTDEVLKAFNTTNRKGTGAIISRYVGTPDATLPDLISAIKESGLFAGKRAEIVGVTESTRAFGVGNYYAGDELSMIAGAKNLVTPGDFFFIFPGHPYCRCGITTEFVYDINNVIVGVDYRWHTVNDFIAAKCPICGPRNEMLVSEIIGKK